MKGIVLVTLAMDTETGEAEWNCETGNCVCGCAKILLHEMASDGERER
jgi:hypothetical protein